MKNNRSFLSLSLSLSLFRRKKGTLEAERPTTDHQSATTKKPDPTTAEGVPEATERLIVIDTPQLIWNGSGTALERLWNGFGTARGRPADLTGVWTCRFWFPFFFFCLVHHHLRPVGQGRTRLYWVFTEFFFSACCARVVLKVMKVLALTGFD